MEGILVSRGEEEVEPQNSILALPEGREGKRSGGEVSK
jgi:hypothetical protein